MNKGWLSRCWQFGIAGALALVGAIASSFEYRLAQIATDDTLGTERSVVTSNVDIKSRINRLRTPPGGIGFNILRNNLLRGSLSQKSRLLPIMSWLL